VDGLLVKDHQGERRELTVLRLEKLTKVFPRAGRVVDSIDLQIKSGEFFTLLGPSGCGKSTILRMIAGFEEPTGGRIFFDTRDVTDDPANRRGIGFVFQNYALFPHLSVAENVAFGLRVRKVSGSETEERVEAALRDVQLDGLGPERVDRLSGGQQQRVALARALVIRPNLLLLDEPLSNLDAKLREDTRAMLRTLRTSNSPTTVYVTHDQAEAMGMSDRVAVLHQGRIHQVGVPEEIYERPATRFVADFIGRNNVLDATVAAISDQSVKLRLADGNELTADPTHKSREAELSLGARVGVCVRAESFRLAIGDGTFAGTISDVEYAGAVRTCRVSTAVGDLHVEVPSSAGRLVKGQSVRLSVNESTLHLVGPRAES
jgi:ABC-type Fe3+/spermidine/putrescine transport system ATPase subunit